MRGADGPAGLVLTTGHVGHEPGARRDLPTCRSLSPPSSPRSGGRQKFTSVNPPQVGERRPGARASCERSERTENAGILAELARSREARGTGSGAAWRAAARHVCESARAGRGEPEGRVGPAGRAGDLGRRHATCPGQRERDDARRRSAGCRPYGTGSLCYVRAPHSYGA